MDGLCPAYPFPKGGGAVRSVAILTMTGILSQLVGFGYRVLLTRLAGAEILGLYQLLLPVYAVLLSLTSVGLTQAVSNLSARYEVLGNRRAIHQLRGQGVKIFFLLALLPCGLLLACSDAASVYILADARTRLGLMLLVPCLLLTGTENLHKHYFYGTGRVLPAALTELIEQVLKAVFILSLLVILEPSTSEKAVGTIVLGMILCEIFSAVTQVILFRVCLGSPKRLPGKGVEKTFLRRQMAHIALPLGFAALLGNLISSLNALLIPRLLTLGGMDQGEAVSAYGITFGMTLPMLLLPTAFLSALGLVLTPKLSQASALGRRETIRNHIRRAVGTANLILIPALSLLAVLGSGLGVTLYKEPAVADHLPLLALGVLFSCWQTLFCFVLSGLDRQGISAVIALVCDLVQLALTCLTVTRFGMGGYAVSFGASSLLGAVLTWQVVARETDLGLPIFDWFAAPTLSACLGTACGDLMETILLRAGMTALPAALGAMGFGLVLYWAGLEAMGVGRKEAV
ncbi:MAG: oligosaccharide flippase family protein [Ruminiclostridium sp.]|nr:oligosaccharide flippase family protein [Ruminiclostridium sp.]